MALHYGKESYIPGTRGMCVGRGGEGGRGGGLHPLRPLKNLGF